MDSFQVFFYLRMLLTRFYLGIFQKPANLTPPPPAPHENAKKHFHFQDQAVSASCKIAEFQPIKGSHFQSFFSRKKSGFGVLLHFKSTN